MVASRQRSSSLCASRRGIQEPQTRGLQAVNRTPHTLPQPRAGRPSTQCLHCHTQTVPHSGEHHQVNRTVLPLSRTHTQIRHELPLHLRPEEHLPRRKLVAQDKMGHTQQDQVLHWLREEVLRPSLYQSRPDQMRLIRMGFFRGHRRGVELLLLNQRAHQDQNRTTASNIGHHRVSRLADDSIYGILRQ